MKILAIGAHPDDIEIFMYGLIAAFKKRGDEIYLAIATDGAAGKIEINDNLKEIREIEARAGLKKLGEPLFLELEDGNLFETPNAFKIISNMINDINPDLIVTHDPNDYHPDHRSLSKFISRAIGFQCPLVFAETLLGINFIPEIYVDITEFFEDKANAILSHKSQNPDNFLNAVRLVNRFRSAQCNTSGDNFAEVYRVSQTFPFTDLRNLFPSAPKLRRFYNKEEGSLL